MPLMEKSKLDLSNGDSAVEEDDLLSSGRNKEVQRTNAQNIQQVEVGMS